ncbi:MAG: hypothetical protein IJN13_03160 [Bacilli bacterium]|nr:hypothetical protein [Bacilli bacterium]
MRKTLGIIFKVLLVTVVVVWIGLILVEYFRYQDNEPMLVVLKEETLAYEDGHVYVYWGLGYKSITYERTSIYGKEFGHVFIPVRDTLPNNS